ncbi:uncharacterized protein LOC130682682 [Manis pentadactyla]|uniref:uncharacterized protein LOC130682682 n=1 Tax=Manis pentadactyla TaxID=143292 RepID=UPI00255CDE83|nr:uncharacterized protein LOC130682682 [Manis pentadactyla]
MDLVIIINSHVPGIVPRALAIKEGEKGQETSGAALVPGRRGGHTQAAAGQRVLSCADPPHFGVETEPSSWLSLRPRDRKILQAQRTWNPADGRALGAQGRAGVGPRPGVALARPCAGLAAPSRARIAPPAGHRPAPLRPLQSRSSWTSRVSGARPPPCPRRSELPGLFRTLPAPVAAEIPSANSSFLPGKPLSHEEPVGRKVESEIRMAHFVSLLHIKTDIPEIPSSSTSFLRKPVFSFFGKGVRSSPDLSLVTCKSE